MFVADSMIRYAKYCPDKIATIDYSDGTRLTYRQLNDRINALAHALLDSGIKRQERVAVICHNSHHYMEIFYAAAKIGAVATSLNWRLSPRELAFQLKQCDAGIAFYSNMFAPAMKTMRGSIERDMQWVIIGEKTEDAVEYEEFLANRSQDEPGMELQSHDPVLQMYTSGTTGTPKGVMLSHKNIIAHAMNTIIENETLSDSIFLASLPIFHVAIYMLINHFFKGATVVFMPVFDAKQMFAVIEKEKITQMSTTPTLLDMLLNHPGLQKHDLSSLRQIGYAGSPMPFPLLVRAMDYFQCRFVQGFGQTESSPIICILPSGDHVKEGPEYQMRRLKSVGRPCINVDVRVVDPEGRDCPQGIVGEIIARGDNVMVGYYKMPEATAEAIRDGWLHTGDMGYFDDYGYLFLADRKKDMIISGGENIYPKEVEMCLLQLDGVADAAVIGVPDDRWGESVKAVIVQKPGAALTEEQVIAHCVAHIASYKKPKSVEFVAELPKNAMGKILKGQLREQYWAGKERKI